jgi:TatD DNase family protein
MIFIDTHTHLYAEEFNPDRDAVVQNARNKGVTRLLLPAIDRSYYPAMMHVAGQHPGTCFPMTGLHPTSVKADYREELDFIKKTLETDRDKFAGIGEIGIDLYWDKTFAEEQTAAFSYQLDLAIEFDLPVAIHTRNSFEIAIDVIRKKSNSRLKGVFHCFGGSAEQAAAATDLGFLLGIGGVITYKNSGLQKVVEVTEPGHLLLETDAPYLPPVPYRGQRNESAYIPVIAQKVAEIKNVTLEEIAEITTRNAIKLFRLEMNA